MPSVKTLIFDTDPSLDDAVASLAASEDLEVLAITTRCHWYLRRWLPARDTWRQP